MATLLPELLQPAGTPCFLLAGHSIALNPLHDDLPANTGHDRKRKIFTTAPRIVGVSIALSAAQAAAYDEWFESIAQVGDQRFTAEVAPLGSNSRYWAAQWVGPPVWTAGLFGRWQLSGALLLTGDGSDELPQGTTLVDEFVVELNGTFAIVSGVALADEFVIELSQATPLFDEFVIELSQSIPTYYEREDGGDILREDGTKLQRET